MSMQVGGSMRAAGIQSLTSSRLQELQQTERQQGVHALESALQSGDMTAARQAYRALLDISGRSASSTGALAEIGQALSRGDLSVAQQAARSLHGHHGQHRTPDTASTAPAAMSSLPAVTPGNSGQLIDKRA